MKSLLAGLAGWKGMAIAAAVIAVASFVSGWQVSSWKSSAAELGKLQAALNAQVGKMEEQNRISIAHLSALEAINTQARADSQRISKYVEATNACRVSDADRRVFIGSAVTGQD